MARVSLAAGLVVAFVVVCSLPLAAAAQLCGDGTMESDEECDDGNTFGGDGCAANCTAESWASAASTRH
jgi:cysteine-rich repeat protein